MKNIPLASLLISGKRRIPMWIGFFLFVALWCVSPSRSHADPVKTQATSIEGVWVPYPENDPDFTPDQAFIFTRAEFRIKDTETPEPGLVFGYRLQGESLILDFRPPPNWEKDKTMSIYATVDFNDWRQSKVKRQGKYLLLQFGPKGPTMRMRRYDRKIPGFSPS